VFTIYLLQKAGTGKDPKTYWHRQGVGFEPNRDGSVNFRLDMFPGLNFQIRRQNGDAQEPEIQQSER
jgi:hypothetical protein